MKIELIFTGIERSRSSRLGMNEMNGNKEGTRRRRSRREGMKRMGLLS